MVNFFTGYGRIFFLAAAFTFLAQGVLFLSSRAQTAMDLTREDFKIAVVLSNASAGDAAAFKTALSALPGVTAARALDAQKAGGALGPALQALGPDFLPRFFEMSVNDEVLLNPKTWVENNITPMEQDASAYYKDEHARLAVYINSLMRLADILLACGAFALVSFGFFVEAYYANITPLRTRWRGVLAAVLAFAAAWGVTFILAAPLNKIYPARQYDMFCWQQAALFAACFLAGWTLSKWKRF